MALTIENTIQGLLLARDPVVAQIETDNYITGVESESELDLTFSGGAAAGDTLVIQSVIMGVVLYFEFVAGTPVGSGGELPAYVSGDVDTWLESVAEYLGSNYHLSKYYSISSSGDAASGEISIVANEISSDYDFFDTLDNVTNMTIAEAAAVEQSRKANFNIRVDVYVEETYKSDDYTLVGSENLVPDSDNQGIFYLQKLIYPYLEKYIPALNMSAITIADGTFKRFYFKYSEYYGSTPAYQKVYTSSVYFALRGGLKFIDYPGALYFSTWLPANKRFLSWKSTSRNISTSQYEFLSFLIYGSGVTSLKLKIKAWYSNTTTETKYLLTKSGTLQKEVYIIPAGYTQLDLESNLTIPSGESVTKYELSIYSQADALLSEVITYIIDTKNWENERNFICENSLSGIDTLRTTGVRSEKTEVTRDLTEKILSDYWQATSIDEGVEENFDNNYQDNYSISTGYKSQQLAINRMKELMISKSVWEIRSSVLVPIIINSKSFRIGIDDNHEYFLAFEYQDAFTNKSYSEI